MVPLWLPMTPNRQFKAKPRLFVGAAGMHSITQDGRRILDGMTGLWCVTARYSSSDDRGKGDVTHRSVCA